MILADEPTGALDSKGGKEVMAILVKLHAQGHTIILVTHDSDIAAYAHRLVRIADGRITSDELQKKDAVINQVKLGDLERDASAGMAVLGESLKMAFRSLVHNRMRTALTMLGIIIGVSSVVALMAIGNGAKQDVVERIQAMGTDLLTVMRGPPAVRASANIVTSFLPEDLPSIRGVPGVGMAVPETTSSSLLRFGDLDLMVSVVGTGEDFPQVHDWPAQSGVFFSAEHVKRYAQVVVLGQTTAKNLFSADMNPLGQYVLIGSAPFLVIGVLSGKGLTPRGDDMDNSAWLPYTTAGARVFGERFFNDFVVRVNPDADMSVVQTSLHSLLMKRHGKEDFNIRNMADTIATANATQNTLTYLAGRHCRNLACGRRHRRDEHHAGLSHGTHPRNRYPHGYRSTQLRRAVSISHRGCDGLLHWRPRGRARWSGWWFGDLRAGWLARDFHGVADHHFVRMCVFDGDHLWLSAGEKSSPPRSHRGAGAGLETPSSLLSQSSRRVKV